MAHRNPAADTAKGLAWQEYGGPLSRSSRSHAQLTESRQFPQGLTLAIGIEASAPLNASRALDHPKNVP